MEKPNILMICVDCFRGDKLFRTSAFIPNMTALMEKGAVFTTAIGPTSTTTPNITSLLTGRYPFEHGVKSLVGFKLEPSIETLPEILGKMSYRTSAFFSGGGEREEIGFHKGFQEYYFRGPEENLNTSFKQQVYKVLDMPSPWFLFIHLWDLHVPRVVPEEFNHRKYGRCKYERAISFIDSCLGDIFFKKVNLEDTLIVLCGDHGESILETPTKKLLAKTENTSLHLLAKVVGRKLDFFRKYINFGPNDHYSPAFHGGFDGHGYHIYDFLVNVPLIFAGNGFSFKGGCKITRQVSLVDVMPTILEHFGITQNSADPKRGRSLLPLIFNKNNTDWEEIVFLRACGKILRSQENWLLGIRTPKWKYAQPYLSSIGREELYNLKSDILELRNVANRHPDLVQEFRKMIELVTDK